MSAALRDRTIRLIVACYATSVLLEWAIDIALMVAVYSATGSASAAAGMLLCIQLLPNGAVALFSGRLDRLAIRPVFAGATAIRAAAALAIAALGYGVAFYVAALVIGAASSVARAQLRAAVARHEEELLRSGNALLGFVRGPCSLIGPVLGGLVVAIAGPWVALAILGALQLALAVGAAARLERGDAASAVLSGEEVPEAEATRPGAPVPVSLLVALAAVFACSFSVDEPVLMAYADQALGAGVGGYSAIFVAWGVGLLAGSAIFARLIDRPMLTLFGVGLALNAVGHLGLVIAPSLPFALAAAAIGGIGNGIDWSALMTAIQEAAPRGRAASTAGRVESLSTIGVGVGVALGGLLADVVGPRTTLAIPALSGVLILAVGLLFLRARHWRIDSTVPRLVPTIEGGAT